jgi:hypothetical protein
MITILTNIVRMAVYYSEPIIFKGIIIEQRIKGTLGITGLYFFKVLIDRSVWHLDVDLSYPKVGGDFKGLTVR